MSNTWKQSVFEFDKRTALKRKAEGDPSDSESGKLLNNTRVEKARTEEISVVRELCVWEVVDRPHDEVVFGTRWVDINKGDEDKPCYRSQLVGQEYKRQAKWSFFTATSPLEDSRILLICATIEELLNDVGQTVAWTEAAVLMLTDLRRAHFYSATRRRVHMELPAEACTDESKVGRLLRSMCGCRVNREFAICQVTTGIGLVQGSASPCIHHHSEKQLRRHHQCHFFFFASLGCHKSRNPWVSGEPRLRAKHSSAWQDRGKDR